MPMDEVVLIAIIVAVFVSLYIASWLLKVDIRGIWKFLAILPLTIGFAIPINIEVGFRIDPTSHNLWPIEIIFYVFPSFFIWAFIMWLHRDYTKSDKPENNAKAEKPWNQPW